MATQTLPVPGQLRQIRSRVETTPGLLRLGQAAVWVLGLVLFLLVWAGVQQHRHALNTVSYEATASITAAQQLKAYLTDMHGDAANELLDTPDANKQAVAGYDQRRVQAVDSLVAAARNITYPREEDLVKRLLTQLGLYEEAVARARLSHRRDDGAAALEEYRHADRIMYQEGEKVPDKGLVAAADTLTRVNQEQLDGRYAAEQRSSGWFLAGVVLPGLVLLGTLAALQGFLFRRMHRVINPALLAATALIAGFLIYVVTCFVAVGRDLKWGKQDAFDSVGFLWRARADAYDANGEAGRRLLDPERHDAHEQAFREKVGRLVTLPPGTKYPDLLAAVRGLRLPEEAGRLPPAFKGHLADELRNITFAGEQQAAKDALATFGDYLAIDDQVRQLEKEKKHREAVQLGTGYKPGELNGAFRRFDAALGKVLQINEDEFHRAIRQGEAALAGCEAVAAVVLLAVAVLTYVGLRPRLREYTV
jgi:hypothetical protein